MTNQEILHQLKEIQGQVNGLIQALEREEQSQSVTATVGEVRRAAILEEVYRQGGIVTAADISVFAQRYGRSPRSCGGYYSGAAPSMTASPDKTRRQLTSVGTELVLETRKKWGEDWLDRLPMDVLSNPHTPDTTIAF